MMNNYADEVWFGNSDVFCKLSEKDWIAKTEPICLPEKRRWQAYVDARRLEITCGEAPYLVSRYDMGTGEIIPIEKRVGLLDRKLRIVNENVETEDEWLTWAFRSLQAVYGYEYQGDNLLIARVNLLLTFVEYLKDRWQRNATPKELHEAAKIISWNIWQMDGLKGTIPMGALCEQYHQFNLCEFFVDDFPKQSGDSGSISCRIFDWRGQNKSIEYNAFREGRNGSMKFDFIIGNPPYQDETLGDNKGFAPPIYDKFMDAAYEVADKVELIHPARFLFNAGSTSKAWNQKMLNDEHFSVLYHEQLASNIFPGTDIKGGVVVSYRDATKNFGAIEVFTKYDEVNTVMHKVLSKSPFVSLVNIMANQTRFDLPSLYEDHPEYRTVIGSNGKDKRFRNNIFEKIPLFVDEKNNKDDIHVLGVISNKRTWKYIPIKYVDIDHENLNKWKVLVVRVNGTGALGEILSTPVISRPGEGYTQTFIGIGIFDTQLEAENTLKYIKTKFLRTLLSVLKITQDNSIEAWKMVPLQDFTPNSDIDWSVPIKAIDQQLYKKYGLSDEEIAFIETHVKEMS